MNERDLDVDRERGRRRIASPTVLFAIMFLPMVIFCGNTACQKIMPGERQSTPEMLLQMCGTPVAVFLAVYSFRSSSTSRRIGLLIVIAFAMMFICGTII